MDGELQQTFKNCLTVNIVYAKLHLSHLQAIANSKLPTNFKINILIFDAKSGKHSNFISVIEAKFQKELAQVGNFQAFFYEQINVNNIKIIRSYAQQCRFPTNFHLNIFIFEARASLQTLLQSMKQENKKSARLGNIPKQPSFTGD